TIFQASHVLDPQTHYQAGAARGEVATWAEALLTLKARGRGARSRFRDEPACEEVADPDAEPDPWADLDESVPGEADYEEAEARIAWQRCGAAFAELLGELTAHEACAYRRRLEGRQVDRLRPRDPAAARATLRAIVEQATTRLGAKLEVHQARDALAAAEAVGRLRLDASPGGGRLPRGRPAPPPP